MTNLANYWVEHNHEVCLLTFDMGERPAAYRLDQRVNRIRLALVGDSANTLAAVKQNLRRLFKLRAAILQSRPQCVISFMGTTNVLAVLAASGTNIPVIVSERSDPSSNHIGREWDRLRTITYKRAARVVAPTARILSSLAPQIRSRGTVIPNPVLPPSVETDPAERSDCLISVGRLGREKGFDILLAAFAKVHKVYPSWKLMIVGEGVLRKDLESLAEQLGIAGSLKFVGQVNNPEDYLVKASIFVMASRYEGFPNALCEAMGCGLAVIHTDCPTGPREIIRDGFDGILVPTENADALAEAISKLITDEELRRTLGHNARRITERFGIDEVMRQWEALLNNVVRQTSAVS